MGFFSDWERWARAYDRAKEEGMPEYRDVLESGRFEERRPYSSNPNCTPMYLVCKSCGAIVYRDAGYDNGPWPTGYTWARVLAHRCPEGQHES